MAHAKLDPLSRDRWMSLDDSASAPGAEKTPGGVLRTNAFDDATGHANLYELLSRVNHSCEPNAIRQTETGGQSVVQLVSCVAIREGDEILVNYMDGIDEGLNVEQRRSRLQQQYRFHCECPRCKREALEARA